jgi:hypothetical protein
MEISRLLEIPWKFQVEVSVSFQWFAVFCEGLRRLRILGRPAEMVIDDESRIHFQCAKDITEAMTKPLTYGPAILTFFASSAVQRNPFYDHFQREITTKSGYASTF